MAEHLGDKDLEDLARRHLVPLLAAAGNERRASPPRQRLGGQDPGGRDVWVRIPGSEDELHLWRPLPLTTPEVELLHPYGEFLSQLRAAPLEIAQIAAPHAVEAAMAAQLGSGREVAVREALAYLAQLANQTYEGQAVSTTVLIDLEHEGTPHGESLDAFRKHNWHSIVGSSLECGLLIDQYGNTVSQMDLPPAHDDDQAPLMSPGVFASQADWTSAGNRLAVSLTRGGEILIHQSGTIRFVHRQGAWRSIPADFARSRRWGRSTRHAAAVKTAVIAATLDASFAHHGACIGVLSTRGVQSFNASDVLPVDGRWSESGLEPLYGKSSFLELSRRQRLELLSMDGALVMDRQGTMIAAGAILGIEGGAGHGGGRTAAALTLARYGSGIKVSQDGPIQVWGLGDGGQTELVLRLG